MDFKAWEATAEETCAYFQVDPSTGLDDKAIEAATAKYGKNTLESKEATPFWKLVLEQFDDHLVKILLSAAIISFILALFEEGDERVTAFVEPLVIGLILIANAIVGVLQETNAEKAIEALKEYEPETAVVLRNGQKATINAKDLVPGDIVEVSVGTCVPADIRVFQIQTVTFRVDQKMLTGESDPVNKDPRPVKTKDVVIQSKTNMLFKGTNCTTGQARGVVVNIGQTTEMGKIKDDMDRIEEAESPLQIKLDEFGEFLSKVIMVICILVWLINIGQFSNPVHGNFFKGAVYYFKIAVALAVAAIPEGLPAVVTTCLALGTVKMAKKNAIVRHLPSVETLGCTTVICSDKTGTLTTSKMSVSRAVVVGDVAKGKGKGKATAFLREFNVEGTTYAPVGKIQEVDGPVLHRSSDYPSLEYLAEVCSMCNNSRVVYDEASDKYDTMGEPTELALRVLTEKIGNSADLAKSKKEATSLYSNYFEDQNEKLATLEFSRDRKSMSVLVRNKNTGKYLLLVKGAPESIISRCTKVRLNDSNTVVPFNDEIRDVLANSLNDMSNSALRVLGFAIADGRPPKDYDFDPKKFGEYEQDMTFIGMVGMLDPPRPEVAVALSTCRMAGIEVIVITGDNKATAEAICKKIGLFKEGEDLSNKSLTGREWDVLSPEEKVERLKTVRLFSRTEPVHKSDIVEILQKRMGNIVAMTGDGVNDAPALKMANIGVGMGSGTAVAKAASDMVLADDNFATIVVAVEEGRAIYSNTKQFIRYLISSNIGEVACIFLTAAIGMPEALIPVQLLWVNLVTDGLPATALGFNKPDADIMKRPPRSADERIINGWMFFRYMVIGVYVGIATVGSFLYWYLYYENGPHVTWEELTNYETCVSLASGASCTVFKAGNKVPSTVALSVLVTIEMFNALNSLSENQSLFQMPPWSNLWLIAAVILSFLLHFMIVYIPFFANIFQITAISWAEWKIVLAASFPIVIIDESFKFLARLVMNSGPKKIDLAKKHD